MVKLSSKWWKWIHKVEWVESLSVTHDEQSANNTFWAPLAEPNRPLTRSKTDPVCQQVSNSSHITWQRVLASNLLTHWVRFTSGKRSVWLSKRRSKRFRASPSVVRALFIIRSSEVDREYAFGFLLLVNMVVLHFLTKNNQNLYRTSWDVLQKPLFWLVFVDIPPNQIFPGKFGSVSCCALLSLDFMLSCKKILWTVF
jgi:hypothetical protein